MNQNQVEKSIRDFFFRKSSKSNGEPDYLLARADRYLASQEVALFDGRFFDPASKYAPSRRVLVTQTHRQAQVLPSGILLATTYTPANDASSSIAGTISGNEIDAYETTVLKMVYHHLHEGALDNIEDKIVAKELGETPAISQDFSSTSDFMRFLREKANVRYKLTLNDFGSWTGKEIETITLFGYPQITETFMALTPIRDYAKDK